MLLQFMEVHRPLVAILENVTGLAAGKREDLEFLLDKLRQLGYEIIERERVECEELPIITQSEPLVPIVRAPEGWQSAPER